MECEAVVGEVELAQVLRELGVVVLAGRGVERGCVFVMIIFVQLD